MTCLVDSEVFDFIPVFASQKLCYNRSVPLSYNALTFLGVLPFFCIHAGEEEFVSKCI